MPRSSPPGQLLKPRVLYGTHVVAARALRRQGASFVQIGAALGKHPDVVRQVLLETAANEKSMSACCRTRRTS